MFSYKVLKHGHKVGHARLGYGEVFTAHMLGVSDDELAILVERGVLERVAPVAPSDSPTVEAGDGEAVSSEKPKKRGKTDD